ncbi:MAG: hypothetical protein VX198_00610 [Pseudomonadota bacterium]|nr:hypothetical protein [Pseudomonadota bacterium]
MFSIGWSEILLILILAVVIVRPKDLPAVFRSVGGFFRKIRLLIQDISSEMNSFSDEQSIQKFKKPLEKNDGEEK